jgi:hypothetical protein
VPITPKTRDNIIYLAVGISIAALVVVQDFYAESHNGRVIVNLSRFAVRAAGSTLLVGYFVAREVRGVSATLAEMVLCVVVAGLLQLAISFTFHQSVGQLSSLPYVSWMTLQTFLIVKLMTRAIFYFKSRSNGA